MTLVCEVQYWPLNNSNNIEVKWYRSRSEESAGIEGEILIDDMHHNPPMISVNQTFIKQYTLGVLNFNSSDRGYYWCQLVVNNVSLSPSPYGYIYSSQCSFLDTDCNIDQPLCAQNIRVRYMAHRQVNGTDNYCSLEQAINITPAGTATMSQILKTRMTMLSAFSSNLPTITASNVFNLDDSSSSQCNFSKNGYPCSIGIIAGIFVFIISLLVLSVILYFFVRKHKSKSKLTVSDLHCKLDDSTVNHYDKVELDKRKEANEVSNPHYSEISIAVDNSLKPNNDCKNDNGSYKGSIANTTTLQRHDNVLSKTEQGNPTTQQHPYSSCAYKTEVEREARLNKNCSDQVGNQESHRIHNQDTEARRTMDVTSEYAVVNKSKKTSKLQSNESSTSRADSVKESHLLGYDNLERNEPSKAIITTVEEKVIRDRSPSPEYAKLSTREMKIPGVTKCPTEKALQKKKSESDSYEHNKLASVDHDSKSVKVTKEKAEEVEQHYYYSLEVSEECCNDNKGKEEATVSHEYDKLTSVDQDSVNLKVTKGEPNSEVEQHYYHSLEVQEECCSDNKGKEEATVSHEYDKLANVDHDSVEITKAEAKEVEQYYYYSLEVQEECCSDNKGKEEITKVVNSGEMECSMPKAHHLIIDDIPIVPNTTPQAELATMGEIVVDSHQREATAD